MNHKCKNPKCKSKGKDQERIIVISECSQVLNLSDDNYTDLEVGDTLYGLCYQCGKKIPARTFAKLLDKSGQ